MRSHWNILNLSLKTTLIIKEVSTLLTRHPSPTFDVLSLESPADDGSLIFSVSFSLVIFLFLIIIYIYIYFFFWLFIFFFLSFVVHARVHRVPLFYTATATTNGELVAVDTNPPARMSSILFYQSSCLRGLQKLDIQDIVIISQSWWPHLLTRNRLPNRFQCRFLLILYGTLWYFMVNIQLID